MVMLGVGWIERYRDCRGNFLSENVEKNIFRSRVVGTIHNFRNFIRDDSNNICMKLRLIMLALSTEGAIHFAACPKYYTVNKYLKSIFLGFVYYIN